MFANVFICFRVLVSFERETLFGLYILYVFVKVFACSGFFVLFEGKLFSGLLILVCL